MLWLGMHGHVGTRKGFVHQRFDLIRGFVCGAQGLFAFHRNVHIHKVVWAGVPNADGVAISYTLDGLDGGLDLFRGSGKVAELTPEKVDVGTTRENLESALKGETYESVTMYPEFIKKAREASITFL